MSSKKGFANIDSIMETNNNRTNHLLGIAINDYKYCPKLQNAVKDVKDFVDLMKTQFSFHENNITTLYDNEATGSNIVRALDKLSSTLTKKDNLIIYFSGHGALHDRKGKGYWIPVDAEQDNYFDYLSNTVIKDYLSATDAYHIFLIADSCFSGALFTTGSKEIGKRLEKNPSRWGLTSGQKEIVLDGKPGENSPFAKSLLYHLKNTSGPIGVQELCSNVLETTAANAIQTPLGEPLQVEGHRNGQFVFRLKKDEIRDWTEAKNIGTIASLEHFLKVYPDGKYAETTKNEINNIKATNAWERIKNSKRSVDFARYKKQFPNSKYFAEAYQRLLSTEEGEEWLSAKRANKITRYEHYIELYPNGRFVADANAAINSIFNVEKITDFKQEKVEVDKRESPKRQPLRIEKKIPKKTTNTNKVTQSTSTTDESPNRKKILFAVLGVLVGILVVWGISNFKSTEEVLELTELEKQKYTYFYSKAQEETKAKNLIAAKINYDEMLEIVKTDSISQKIWDLEGEEEAHIAAINDKTPEKSKEYLSRFPNGFYVEVIQKKLELIRASSESEAWGQIYPTEDTEIITAFLQKYPNGEYADKAKMLIEELQTLADETAWNLAKRENTAVAYNTYLEEQVNGVYRSEATIQIKAIRNAVMDKQASEKDDAAWKTAKSINTIAAYNTYLENRNGKYRSEALAQIKVATDKQVSEKDDAAWRTAKSMNTIAAYNTYLENRNGKYRSEALATRKRLIPRTPHPSDPFGTQMVNIQGGTFQMGDYDGNNIHKVTLSGFFMSKYEVTQQQWREIMGTNPSYFKNCDNCPVEQVSWNDVQEFIEKLNAKTGENYRLPTEAEWEYAARGGETYKYAGSDNIGSVVWYKDNSGGKTNPVGQKSPNGYGLYDMSGNVWEWCSDWYGSNYYNNSPSSNPKGPNNGTDRILRGGSWDYVPNGCRVVHRGHDKVAYGNNRRGFRLVLP